MILEDLVDDLVMVKEAIEQEDYKDAVALLQEIIEETKIDILLK